VTRLGYLLKDTNRAALFDTIHDSARDDTLLKSKILASVISHAATLTQSSQETATAIAPE